MKRILAVVALSTLVACGGESVVFPNGATAPEVAGTWNIAGMVGFAPYGGTVTLNQPSRQQAALTGWASVSTATASDIYFTNVSDAAVSQTGQLSFTITTVQRAATWRFTGTVSGTTVTGTTTMVDASGSVTGNFTMTRQ
jgi:hypothetical protein